MRVESQLDLEDSELIRLGFSFHEVSTMTLYQRQTYLQCGGIVRTWAEFGERRRLMDVMIMTSGYVEREPKREIQRRWQSELKSHIGNLADFTIETRARTATPRPTKKRKFIDVLRGLKANGQSQNLIGGNESVNQAGPESLAH